MDTHSSSRHSQSIGIVSLWSFAPLFVFQNDTSRYRFIQQNPHIHNLLDGAFRLQCSNHVFYSFNSISSSSSLIPLFLDNAEMAAFRSLNALGSLSSLPDAHGRSISFVMPIFQVGLLDSCSFGYLPFSARGSDRGTGLLGTFQNKEVSIDIPVEIERHHEALYLVNYFSNFTVEPISLPSDQEQMQTLIQTDTSLKMIALMLDPVMSGIFKPVLKTTIKFICANMMSAFSTRATKDTNAEVPKDVAAMMEPVLIANLSNVLIDALAVTTSSVLGQSLSETLGPPVAAAVAAFLPPRLHHIIHSVLLKRIPPKVDIAFPHQLDRVLQLTLFNSLTRSITHSVVPVLAQSLTHSKHSDRACYECYSSKTNCELCHFSRKSTYYTSYYSAFYSDYYADYYGRYYSDALVLLDQVSLHPNTESMMVMNAHSDTT